MGLILVARRDLSLHPQTSEVEPPPPNHWQQLHATDFPRELDDTGCEPMWKNHGKTPRIFRMVIQARHMTSRWHCSITLAACHDKKDGISQAISSLILSNPMRKWNISNIYLKSLTYYNFSWHVLIVRFTRRLDPLGFVPSFSTAICLVDPGTSLIQWGSDRFVSLVSFGMSKTCRNYSTTT